MPERRRADTPLDGPVVAVEVLRASDRRESDEREVDRRESDRRQGDRRAGAERRIGGAESWTGEERRAGAERRAAPDRRSGTDRRGLMDHARDFALRFRGPLIGLSMVAASMPLIRAGDRRSETERETVSAKALASAAPMAAPTAAPSRAIGAELGSRLAGAGRSIVDAAVSRYGISEDLASRIYDHATNAGLDPKMAYGLVKTESDFKNTAVSHVGARGLTQLMPGTARWLEPGTKASDLFDTELNLKMGFKYLRQLIDRYDGNRQLALTAYNRGPGTVARALKKGRDPDNGYAATVLRNALRDVADSMGLGAGDDGPSSRSADMGGRAPAARS